MLSPGVFTTSGDVYVAPGSSISRTGNYTQTAGSTIVDGTLSASTGVEIQGGTLGGSGTISSPVTSSGAVAPGASAGILTIGSTYEQDAAGELAIEIGGLNPGTEHDRLDVTGNATLSGTLSVEFINGFNPNLADSFTVMTYPSKTGTFANFDAPCLPGGRIVQVSVRDTEVVVAISAGVEADVDCDCALSPLDVDAFTLALLDPDEYAATHPTCDIAVADFNGDLSVNGLDTQGFLDAFTP